MLADFSIFWQRERDPAVKCQLPALIFERIWLDEQRIVAVQPKGAICALLQHPDAPPGSRSADKLA